MKSKIILVPIFFLFSFVPAISHARVVPSWLRSCALRLAGDPWTQSKVLDQLTQDSKVVLFDYNKYVEILNSRHPWDQHVETYITELMLNRMPMALNHTHSRESRWEVLRRTLDGFQNRWTSAYLRSLSSDNLELMELRLQRLVEPYIAEPRLPKDAPIPGVEDDDDDPMILMSTEAQETDEARHYRVYFAWHRAHYEWRQILEKYQDLIGRLHGKSI